LVAHLHFSNRTKPNKNAKELPSQRTTKRLKTALPTTSVLQESGLSAPIETFSLSLKSELRLRVSANKSAPSQSRKPLPASLK